jgi:hypothetical protein
VDRRAERDDYSDSLLSRDFNHRLAISVGSEFMMLTSVDIGNEFRDHMLVAASTSTSNVSMLQTVQQIQRIF